MIPLSVPSIKGNEWKYIKECLDTEWVSSVGKYVDKFEEEICKYMGVKYAVACINGTAALQVALRLVGVAPGDEVIVPTVSFIAPVNVVRYLCAEPIFMDCDDFYNIDIEKAIDFINNETVFKDGYSYNKSTRRRISAIIPVHVFGNAVELEELIPICNERNIKIVEDAAESIGTYYNNGNLNGRYTGTVGDIGCYSFNGNKIITAGGGGMIVTNIFEYADRARYLTTQAKDDDVYYIHNDIGYNFRLTNIQAAMGVAQLEQLPIFLKKKRDIYRRYKEGIIGISRLKIAAVPAYAKNNHWMIVLQIDPDEYGKDMRTLMVNLKGKGIETRPVWHLNHLQKPYKNCQSYKIEKATELLAKTLNIPSSVNITEEQINFVIDTFSESCFSEKK